MSSHAHLTTLGTDYESTHPTLASELPEHTDASSQHVKLSKLTLQPFNEDITNWTLRGFFEPAVHKNTMVPHKFKYLSSLLERNAREAISQLTQMSTNYHEVISILKKRFGNSNKS